MSGAAMSVAMSVFPALLAGEYQSRMLEMQRSDDGEFPASINGVQRLVIAHMHRQRLKELRDLVDAADPDNTRAIVLRLAECEILRSVL